MLKTKKYVTVHMKSSSVLNLPQNLPLTIILMRFAKKAGLKLKALAMITPYMDLNKARLVLNAFFMSQLNYCQLV